MRKKFLSVAGLLAFGTAVMFTSCSNDDVIGGENPGIEQGTEDNSQVLTLNIASSGDGLQTRAGRPLYSNEAAQKIDNVALYFVSSDKIVLTKLVAWNQAVDYDDARGHGKELEIALKGKQKLDDGSYTIYAVGYSNSSDYTFSPTAPTDDTDTYDASSATAWGDFQVTLGQGKTDAEEIFAGSTTVTVADGSFSLATGGKTNAITLHRQVAGITGYFTNIPVSVNGKLTASVRLVSVTKNTVAQFGHFYKDFTENEENSAELSKYIVNGTTAAADETGVTYADGTTKAHTIYTIDLDDWFVVPKGKTLADCDLDGDGFLGYKDVQKYVTDNQVTVTKPSDYEAIWKNPYSNEAKFVRGSIFSGKFVIPFEKGTSNTLQLQLLDASGNILKYWNINAAEIHTTKSDEEEEWEKTDTDASIYNIYRNHMYNVGMKAATNPGDPDKPVNPEQPDPEQPDPDDPDPENPEDLSKGQNLIIQVNDNWEIIHDMVLD